MNSKKLYSEFYRVMGFWLTSNYKGTMQDSTKWEVLVQHVQTIRFKHD
jgi:hypothetical protein